MALVKILSTGKVTSLRLFDEPQHAGDFARIDVIETRLGIESGSSPTWPSIESWQDNRPFQTRRFKLTVAAQLEKHFQHAPMRFRVPLREHLFCLSLTG